MDTKAYRVCVATGSRAEYGLLYWPMQAIAQSSRLELQLLVTGMHLSPEFGLTYQSIESDGFSIDAKVEMLLSSDSGVGIAKSMGLGMIGVADALERLKPDIVMLLGDRFEMLAVASAALAARIPIAHIAGGDSTEGAFDESIRHSITKMSHIHFVTNRVAASRVRQLGENPEHVHLVGSPGLDHLRHVRPMARDEVSKRLGWNLRARNFLITVHPETLSHADPLRVFTELAAAVDALGSDIGLIFTLPNADPGGRALQQAAREFAEGRENAVVHVSLGQSLYLGALGVVDGVVGNSSSGLYEAPSFGIGTVNIGERQRGRLMASSVISCEAEREAISSSLARCLDEDFSGTVNPYGDGRTSERILTVLEAMPAPSTLLVKRFFGSDAFNE